MKKLLLALAIAILANQTAVQASFVTRLFRPAAAKTATQAVKQPKTLAIYAKPAFKAAGKGSLGLYLIGCAFATQYEMKSKSLNYRDNVAQQDVALNPVAAAAGTFVITALHTAPASAAVCFKNQVIKFDKGLYNAVQKEQHDKAVEEKEAEAAQAERTQRYHEEEVRKAKEAQRQALRAAHAAGQAPVKLVH